MTSPAQGATARPVLEQPAGTARGDVTVEGVRFSVLRAGTQAGQARPALLLHGVPQTSLVWRDLMPELARDRAVLAPDLKGLGQSQVQPPYDIPTLVRELAALVESEYGGESVDVVGHDWGGALAIALTAARPDLVTRLVVVNAPYREVDLRYAWHMPLFALPVLPEVLMATAGRQFWGLVFDRAWHGPEALPAELREHYLDAYDDRERVRAMLAYYRGTVRPRVKALPKRALHRRLGRPVAPARAKPQECLVVWGDRDPVFPLRIGEQVARDLGAELLVAEGSGHFPVEENPDLVIPAIAGFLRRADRG